MKQVAQISVGLMPPHRRPRPTWGMGGNIFLRIHMLALAPLGSGFIPPSEEIFTDAARATAVTFPSLAL